MCLLGRLRDRGDALRKVARHTQIEICLENFYSNCLEPSRFSAVYQWQSQGWQNLSERYAYDQAGRLLLQTNAAGETTSYAYDMRGNVLSMTQPMGHTARSAYDARSKY